MTSYLTRRLVTLLCSLCLGSTWLSVSLSAQDVIVADFESETYGNWTATGTAFGEGPAYGALPGGQQEVSGFRGGGLASSYHGADPATGSLTSPEFPITHKYLAFLIGGGNDQDQVGLELLIDDRTVRTASGPTSETLVWHTWDVGELLGKNARLRVFDSASGGWGHVLLDHVIQTAEYRQGSGEWRIDEYSRSSEYYQEPFRPQYHFSPPLNWMNDPNGLVYLEGEYHLFYQHNPHGNGWGHMSWGHAVSRDLVHWSHLPIALHEEYGVMIFSGSCVVDEHNTSGFGTGEQPPLVAIYTGHGHGRQTQDLAYSNDAGRTWIKYLGNPVLDIGEADFRDPKVFWHAPTQRWIMVVALAAQKRVQFYASSDLKQWTYLSDFGPAGVVDKPNWECPDLFELPIEQEPAQSRWVLEVDMGGGAVAGGSGGEYFIGHFDGQRFIPEDPSPPVRWVDYGRDFYAPVSWSNLPPEDDRRLWIGWMNNWETALLPTHPWRSAMSIPRALSLRRTGEGLRLAQTPVHELTLLRGETAQLENVALAPGETSLTAYGVAGSCLEILAEFDLAQAEEVGLSVREGPHQQTLIGYDRANRQLFVDRSGSGIVDFHPRFPGRHTAPLDPEAGRIRLHVFLDSSSIEVFAAQGTIVITDRIFPASSSRGVSAYAKGAGARLSLQAWPLQSIWKPEPAAVQTQHAR